MDPGFGQGGPQLLRPEVTDVAEWSCVSEASYLWWGSGSGAQLCILLHSGDSFSLIFDIYCNTKADEYRTLDCTSINLGYSYILQLFFNVHEMKKLYLD